MNKITNTSKVNQSSKLTKIHIEIFAKKKGKKNKYETVSIRILLQILQYFQYFYVQEESYSCQ